MSLTPALASYTQMIQQLHTKWTAHEGQIPVGQAYFRDKKSSIFLTCGRKFGKTELGLYFAWRIAIEYPGSPIYYIAPLQTQAREIVWSDPRLIEFGPRERLKEGSKGINHTEMRLNFANDSFIKVDGSDNYDKYRGVRYKLAIYEEYKDHKPAFRKAMRPNASVLSGLDLYMGTPPEIENDFNLLAREHQNTEGYYHHHAPTWHNPHIDRQWLLDEKKRLYLRGDGDEWEREYAAREVSGGAKKIFPMLSKSIVYPHAELMKELHRDRKKLHWFAWSDPAGATCFAVLFLAFNPYSKRIYILDEIYETKQAEMTTQRIGKRILEKREELYDHSHSWCLGYDEAATWFANEWMDNFEEEPSLQPSHKHLNKKVVGITLIKDILLAGLMKISDRCQKFYWEMDRYSKDDKGKIPKVDDHLIDDLRYTLGAEGYSMPETIEIIPEKDPMYRGSRMVDDFAFLRDDNSNSEDWGDYNE